MYLHQKRASKRNIDLYVQQMVEIGIKLTLGDLRKTRLRLKVLSARECINQMKYDKNNLIGQID